jgi:hypothetical protein
MIATRSGDEKQSETAAMNEPSSASRVQQAVLHVTFGSYSDKPLRAALKRAERDELVAGLWDDLSLGPIDPPDPKVRWAWARQEMGLFAQCREIFAEKNNAWDAALSIPGRRIGWTSRRSADEFCGFLEWIWRLGDAPCEIVDLHEVEIDWHRRDGTIVHKGIPSLARLFPEQFQADALWDLARPITEEERRHYRDLWQRLRSENAPLRILKGETLVSAPITHFDELIFSNTRHQFRKVARVIGDCLNLDAPEAGMYVYHGRLRKLVQAGRLESAGQLSRIRFSEVRRAPKRPSEAA